MKRTFLLAICSLLYVVAALGQAGPAPNGTSASQGPNAAGVASPQGGQPVSYASIQQLNALLQQLEANAQTTQADLSKLRIDRWKTDSNSKKQTLANVESIQRNLQGALPEIIAQLRSQPEDLPATFKLYRNLDALYDVIGSVTEITGAFGSKDDFQSLSNDLSAFEGSRKQLAQRMENLSSAKEAEIARLRNELKTAQAAVPATPPKKTVIDDTEPPKKPPVKKKATTKKPADTTKPAAGQTPPQQQQPPPPKPQ